MWHHENMKMIPFHFSAAEVKRLDSSKLVQRSCSSMTHKGLRKKWALSAYLISMFMNLNRGKASARNSMSICYRFVKRLIHHISDVRVNLSSLFLRHSSGRNHWTVLILGPRPADYRHKSGDMSRALLIGLSLQLSPAQTSNSSLWTLHVTL